MHQRTFCSLCYYLLHTQSYSKYSSTCTWVWTVLLHQCKEVILCGGHPLCWLHNVGNLCAGLLVGQCAFVGHASDMYVRMYICMYVLMYAVQAGCTSLSWMQRPWLGLPADGVHSSILTHVLYHFIAILGVPDHKVLSVCGRCVMWLSCDSCLM